MDVIDYAAASLPLAAAAKKQRVGNNDIENITMAMPEEAFCLLLSIPKEVLEHVLSYLDANSLANVAQTVKAFRVFDAQSGLRLVDKIAKAAVIQAAGEDAERWRRRSWLSRLYVEDCGVGFQKFQWSSPSSPAPAGVPPSYRFTVPSSSNANLHIKLDGMGPKLLVSDLSTADQPLLRWRLVVRGNTAVEFGVVPLSMVEDDKSLHKCQQDEKKFDRLTAPLVDSERPTGFCSSITVGSMLPFKTSIMKGSVVELLARRGRLEILVQNPLDGQELYWHNTRTVPKPYKGPREIRFEQDFSPHHDVKLALTSWAHGAFDVLHPSPGSRLEHSSPRSGWDAQQVKVAGEAAPSVVQQQLQQAVVQHVQHMLQQQVNEVQQLVLQHLVQQPGPVLQPDLAQPGQLALVSMQQAEEQAAQQQQQQQQAWPGRQAGGSSSAAAAAASAGAAPSPASPASEESTSSRDGQLLS